MKEPRSTRHEQLRLKFALYIEINGEVSHNRAYKHNKYIPGSIYNDENDFIEFYKYIVSSFINGSIKLPFDLDFDNAEFRHEEEWIFVKDKSTGKDILLGRIEMDTLVYIGVTNMPKPNDPGYYVPCARIYYDDFEAFLEEGHDMWEVCHYRRNERGRFSLNKIFDFKDTGNHGDTINTLIKMMLKYKTTYDNQREGITDYE